jgi:PilZ domain-containing protein
MRLQLGISARFETLDGRQRVRLMDLSQGGAHLVLSENGEFREGMLTWLRFETFGTVVWHEGPRIGLEFDKLLPLGVLVETRLRAPSVVREEEEQLAREWVGDGLPPRSGR